MRGSRRYRIGRGRRGVSDRSIECHRPAGYLRTAVRSNASNGGLAAISRCRGLNSGRAVNSALVAVESHISIGADISTGILVRSGVAQRGIEAVDRASSTHNDAAASVGRGKNGIGKERRAWNSTQSGTRRGTQFVER